MKPTTPNHPIDKTYHQPRTAPKGQQKSSKRASRNTPPWHLILLLLTLTVLSAACSPTPRTQGVDAVVPPAPASGDLPPASTTATPFLLPDTPTPTGEVEATETETEAQAEAESSATPAPTATPHPDLPETCNVAPPQNDFTATQGYVDLNSVCRGAITAPNGRWLAFTQLVSGGNGEELWLYNYEDETTTPITGADWQGEFYRSLDYYAWTSNSILLITHRQINSLVPAHVFDPDSGELHSLGTVNGLFWSDDYLAIIGWAFEDSCLFSRIVGWDFEAGLPLSSEGVVQEVVGQAYFIPGTHDYLYTRSGLRGNCPQCVYLASELVLATDNGQTHTMLLDDDDSDYLLYGFSGLYAVVGRRDYQSRACQDPSDVTETPVEFLALDLTTGDLYPLEQAPTPTPSPEPEP